MILNIQIIANLFFLVLGLVYGGGALMLPEAMFGNPNAPKIYPLIISAGLIVFSSVLLAAEFGRQKKGTAEKAVVFKLEAEGKLVAFVTSACIIYAFVFERLGYVISTFVFLIAVMAYISKGKKLVKPVIIALLFSFGVYVIFAKLLAITLPPMPFIEF